MNYYKRAYLLIFFLIEKRNQDPKFAASTFVTINQWIHIALILAIVKYLFDLDYSSARFSEDYSFNKLAMMPFFLIWMLIVARVFKKNHEVIVRSFSREKIINIKNTLLISLGLFIPLISTILLLRK